MCVCCRFLYILQLVSTPTLIQLYFSSLYIINLSVVKETTYVIRADICLGIT
jgi:hypothetical protein